MLKSKSSILLVLLSAFLWRCDCRDNANPMPDGGLLPDGTEPFDPAVMYEGESAACRFSVDCGASQICVSDQCIRQERVAYEELEYGEWRTMTPTELDQSPMYRLAATPWASLDFNMYGAYEHEATRYLWGVTSWMSPGTHGSQVLATTFHPDRCQAILFGSRVRVFAPADMNCLAGASDERGFVVLAGADVRDGQNVITVFDNADRLIVRATIPQQLHARVARATNWGPGSAVGLVNSVFIRNDDVYIAAMRGTDQVFSNPFKTNSVFGTRGLVFIKMNIRTGAMDLQQIAGQDTVALTRGWIVEDETGLHALVSDPGTGHRIVEDTTFEAMDIPSGERRVLVAGNGYDGRYSQPSRQQWIALVNSPKCRAAVFGLDETPWDVSITPSGECGYVNDSYYDNGNFSGRAAYRDLPPPDNVWGDWYAHVDHPEFKVSRVVGIGVEAQFYFQDGSIRRETVSAALPGYSDIGNGTISRFRKTIELMFIDDGAQHFVGWAEWALRRRGMP